MSSRRRSRIASDRPHRRIPSAPRPPPELRIPAPRQLRPSPPYSSYSTSEGPWPQSTPRLRRPQRRPEARKSAWTNELRSSLSGWRQHPDSDSGSPTVPTHSSAIRSPRGRSCDAKTRRVLTHRRAADAHAISQLEQSEDLTSGRCAFAAAANTPANALLLAGRAAGTSLVRNVPASTLSCSVRRGPRRCVGLVLKGQLGYPTAYR